MKNETRTGARTCIGCRRRAGRDALARLALADGRMVFWGPGHQAARPAGRGASLHPDAGCLRAALKTGAFARAFRGSLDTGTLDETDLLRQLMRTKDNVNRNSP